MPKNTQSKIKSSFKKNASSGLTNEVSFENSISAEEFMKQIREIQKSRDKQDQELRHAAKNYMNSLRCV